MTESERSRSHDTWQTAERFRLRVEFLREHGWDMTDASRYVSLHHVRLEDDLSASEDEEARTLERKHHAPDDFGIFSEFPPGVVE